MSLRVVVDRDREELERAFDALGELLEEARDALPKLRLLEGDEDGE